MNGVINGGWSYVIAAYAISAVLFLSYGISLFVRLRGDSAS